MRRVLYGREGIQTRRGEEVDSAPGNVAWFVALTTQQFRIPVIQ